jgi:hypothetical protein
MKKERIDPEKRGMEDPPKSKAAKRWKAGQDSDEMRSAMEDGAYDDGGYV